MGTETRGISKGDGDGSVGLAGRDVGPVATWRPPEVDDRPAGRTDAVDLLAVVDPVDGLSVLDDPRRILTEGYIGRDRRRDSAHAQLARVTWAGRRRLLRLDLLFVLALAGIMIGAVLLVGSGGHPVHTPAAAAEPAPTPTPTAPAAPTPTAPAAAAPTATAAPTAVTPAPTAAGNALDARSHTPTTAPVVTAAPVLATTDATSASAPGTPQAMGVAALALIQYPWQQLPGYSIDFRPISDAPSPGFYGNTDFTWGTPGGTSTLYVYPGETVERLAAITAFEIGHEVDAAYVEPVGGHDAIESILGIHPTSWAPQCDCAEQGYLSGWYAAAFSDRWSPGVGDWSSLASAPTGVTLAAMEPWLDPRVP